MNIRICSKPTVEKMISGNTFPDNTAVVSFYDPVHEREAGYAPVDFKGLAEGVIYACLPDIRYEHLSERGYTFDSYFMEARDVAAFVKKAVGEGLGIICQCDWGMGRSAGCCAAIMEYYEGSGLSVFADYRYQPNQLVFNKLLDELRKSE